MEVIGYNYFDIFQTVDWSSKDSMTLTNFPEPRRNDAELQLTFADGSKSYYEPLQFHWHAPSEHTVNGKQYDLEVHFVHNVKR